MEKYNILIEYLLAVQNFAKDIHYTSTGEAAYSKHLLADRVQENLYDFIDKIKEVCILGNDTPPLPSGEYLSRATSKIPQLGETDRENFRSLQALIINTLSHIEKIDDITTGEANLIGNIAEDLQNNLGLINLQVRD